MAQISTRASQLDKLAQSLPGANQKVQAGLQGARTAQMQQAIQQAPSAMVAPSTAQQLGAQQAGVSGQIALQGAQQTAQQQQGVGQLALQELGRQGRAAASSQQLTLSAKQAEQANRLSRLDNSVKNKLVDGQLAIQEDSAGNKVLNERQLADAAVVKATSKEQLLNYQQVVEQANQRKIQLLQHASDVINQTIQQGYIKQGQALSQDMQKQLLEKKMQIDKDIQEKRNNANNITSIFGTVGTIAGGVIGGIYGGPMGAAAGASVGSGAGTIVGGLMANNTGNK